MTRLMSVLLACAPLVLSVAACKKAHDAGNDSMRVPGGAVIAIVDLSNSFAHVFSTRTH